jgi:hypothetical protein
MQHNDKLSKRLRWRWIMSHVPGNRRPIDLLNPRLVAMYEAECKADRQTYVADIKRLAGLRLIEYVEGLPWGNVKHGARI